MPASASAPSSTISPWYSEMLRSNSRPVAVICLLSAATLSRVAASRSTPARRYCSRRLPRMKPVASSSPPVGMAERRSKIGRDSDRSVPIAEIRSEHACAASRTGLAVFVWAMKYIVPPVAFTRLASASKLRKSVSMVAAPVRAARSAINRLASASAASQRASTRAGSAGTRSSVDRKASLSTCACGTAAKAGPIETASTAAASMRMISPCGLEPGSRNASRLLGPEDEIHRAEHAQPGPDVVEFQRLLHVVHRERHEHRQGNDFLQDLELAQRHHAVADPVGRHLQHVLEERDAPARQRGHQPRLAVERLQVRVPGERHEHVAHRQQQDRQPDLAHGMPPRGGSDPAVPARV